MRRLICVLGMLAGVVMGLWGCGGNNEPEAANELWSILNQQSYQRWRVVEGFENLQEAKQPNDDPLDRRPLMVRIFYNDVANQARNAGKKQDLWPVGSIFVKDAYQGSDHKAIVAMQKREKGWFWAQWNPKGEAMFSGTPEGCVSCHAKNAANNDLVVTVPLPR